jgi:hypothetical protein
MLAPGLKEVYMASNGFYEVYGTGRDYSARAKEVLKALGITPTKKRVRTLAEYLSNENGLGYGEGQRRAEKEAEGRLNAASRLKDAMDAQGTVMSAVCQAIYAYADTVKSLNGNL